jgi:hypothetical protein
MRRRKARRRSATLIQFERDDLYIMLGAVYVLSIAVGSFFF